MFGVARGRAFTISLIGPVSGALFAGCAPAYRPPAPFVPILEQQGDAHLAVHVGTGGAQVDGAYAATQSFAARAGAQVAGYNSDGAYTLGTVGAGFYTGRATNVSVSLVGGAGYSRGVTKITSTVTTASGQESESEISFQNSGTLVTAALRTELGRHTGKVGAVGFNIGPTWHRLAHDSASDGTGTGQMVLLETAGVARGGPAPVMFEGSLGLAYPLWVSDSANGEGAGVGLPIPLVLAVGVTFDLSKPPGAPPAGAPPTAAPPVSDPAGRRR